jgi:hypothetical protein
MALRLFKGEIDMTSWSWDTVIRWDIDTGKIYIDGIEVYYDSANEVYRPLGK